MNIILFLGAGFSRAFGYPTMDEFFPFADVSKKLDEDEKEFLRQLVLDARSANSFLQSSPTNLEDILSFSVMAERLSLNKDSGETTNFKTRKILQKIFTQVAGASNFWEQFESFKSFLTFDPASRENHKLSIITTNYDVSIECALIQLGASTNPGFQFVQEENKDRFPVTGNLYSKAGILVYKLHGSVNWYKSENNPDSFRIEDRIVEVSGHYAERRQHSLPYVNASNYANPDAPIIIPPSFLKPDLTGALSLIWKGAAEQLQAAHILVFVGYSFPLTDTDMMYFLARSLTKNASLRSILIIDPSAKAIVDKLNSSESKFGSHFKSLIKVNNSVWQKTNLKAYL